MTAASEDTTDTAAPSFTVLWSTQTGRAKACARRATRIIRSEKGLRVAGGCAFDDNGPDFLTGMQPRDKNSCLLLFVSTTGDGEQCDSICQTWKALRNKSLESNLYSEVKFAIFCLGDRAYGPQFCAAGRKLAARLVQLGAMPFCAIGWGDDGTPNGGVFCDLDVWLEQTLIPAIDDKWSGKVLPPGSDQHVPQPSPYRVTVQKDISSNLQPDLEEWRSDRYSRYYNDYFSCWCPLSAYTYQKGQRLRHHENIAIPTAPLKGEVVLNERITASTWEQDTRHLQIRVDVSEIQDGTGNGLPAESSMMELPYQAGDVATILPWNTQEAVAKFLKVLPSSAQSLADHELEISQNEIQGGATRWPGRCTLRGLLTYCADICSLPEREDLRALSHYCRLEHAMGQEQRDKLLSLSETSGAALFGDYVLREKRSWADVLYDFDSIRWEGSSGSADEVLTLEALLALLPPIQPRHFSIASAPSRALIRRSIDVIRESCFDIELCVAVVKGNTPLGRSFEGLCSNYLASQIPNDGRPLCLWIRPGSFGKLPLDITSGHRFETPVLCIGAGTGIAPLRSLILEREAVRSLSKNDCPLPDASEESDTSTVGDSDNILVFGCRKEKADYYYKDEWEAFVNAKRLNLLTAFSRDQWHKIYVQQVLSKAENGLLISHHVLDRGGAIYVAGGAKMARAAKDEILECLAKTLGEKQASLVLKKLQRVGRYSVEAWS